VKDKNSNNKNKDFKDFDSDQFVSELAIKLALAEQIILPAILKCNAVGIDDRLISVACMDISKGLIEGLADNGVTTRDGRRLTWEEGLDAYSKIFKKSAFGTTLRNYIKIRSEQSKQNKNPKDA
jgi:hypothetical protein